MNFAVQYEPLDISESEKQDIISSKTIETMLQSVTTRFHRVLQQNTITNIFVDDIAALGDDDTILEQGSVNLSLILFNFILSIRNYKSFKTLPIFKIAKTRVYHVSIGIQCIKGFWLYPVLNALHLMIEFKVMIQTLIF